MELMCSLLKHLKMKRKNKNYMVLFLFPEYVLSSSILISRIEIHFNINHTVDNEAEANIDPSMEKPDFGELKSKPTFDVDIKRGNSTLSFTCSFFETQPPETEDGYSKYFSTTL